MIAQNKARLAWITEGEEIDEPEGWRVVAVVTSYHDSMGLYHVLVVQEREVYGS